MHTHACVELTLFLLDVCLSPLVAELTMRHHDDFMESSLSLQYAVPYMRWVPDLPMHTEISHHLRTLPRPAPYSKPDMTDAP